MKRELMKNGCANYECPECKFYQPEENFSHGNPKGLCDACDEDAKPVTNFIYDAVNEVTR